MTTDLDTDDYNQLSNINVAKNNFKRILDETPGGPQSGDRLAIAHDIHQATATELTDYMLSYLKSKGYRGVTMGECMGEPKENWYRTSSGGSTGGGGGTTNPPPTTGNVSKDGKCGAANGNTICQGSGFGNCCSQYGWCGSTADHCGGTTTPPPSTGNVSKDGKCGAANGNTICKGSGFGDCCSQYGWCGSTPQHCGTA